MIPQDDRAIVQGLQAAAKGLGAVRLGVASMSSTPAEHADAFQTWLAKGDHGSMEYLAETAEDRLDPLRRFAWARSAVLCAFPYGPEAGDPATLLPTIARYARGDDYHALLPGLMQQLSSHLEGLTGRPHRNKTFSDTSALMERDLARRAGLGWIGKHSGLLTEESGSWLLLAGFLTELELPGSVPVEERCGTCRACLDACPTGAITEPYQVDARRCIAYLTIEHRGWIPREMRPWLADWLFGCDLCQEACPWNQHAPQGLKALRARPDYSSLTLPELISLPMARYTALFKGSALKRATRAGLRRNAIILAGNRKDASCREALLGALSDGDPVLRGTAAWALGRLGGSRETIREALGRESDPEVRSEMAGALT